MLDLTMDFLKKIISPLAAKDRTETIEKIIEGFLSFFPAYEINTVKRIAAFVAEALEETGGFRWLTELGGPSYFAKYEPGTPIGARLGNTQRGDGYRYRGRGIFQLTGRANYKKYGDLLHINLVDDPDKASQPITACHVACEFWKQHSLNPLADQGNMQEITHRINGGYNGLAQRLSFYRSLFNQLGHVV